MVFVKLSSHNYLLWKKQVVPILGSHNLLGYVDGTIPPPQRMITSQYSREEINPEFPKWETTDQMVMSLINNTLSEEVLGETIGFAKSKEVWDVLLETYARPSKPRALQLRHELQTIQRGSDSIKDFLQKFKGILDSLAAMDQSPDEEEKVYWLLQGLGPEYDVFATSMLTRDFLPSYPQVVPHLLSHELHLQAAKMNKPSGSDVVIFMQRDSSSNNFRGGRFRGGRSNQWVNSSNQQQGSYNHVRPQNPSNDTRPSCKICGRRNHATSDCYHQHDPAYQNSSTPQALAAMTINDRRNSSWYPDTGATVHMTNNPGNLTHVHPYFGSDKVIVGNGAPLSISHVGSVNIPTPTGNIHLRGVLLVPEIQRIYFL
ncbi:hypothetical protein GIB67_032101 [Kingdonia uniflora]|uniref:Retrovirus-related Pol polyprotein from transposon TNT 1-94-like beta-barrel domain-containing protein n=1 Tax=Kingdonia uniflora TaxID=39325 RepID=A0A7J7MX29_9MAGN|nr:hypothetical protein GIB67_032101 [Kingdonia uniflora]